MNFSGELNKVKDYLHFINFRESVYRKYLFYKNLADLVEIIVFVQNPISWSFAASKSTTDCDSFMKHLDQYVWMMKFYEDFLKNSKDSFVIRVEDLGMKDSKFYEWMMLEDSCKDKAKNLLQQNSFLNEVGYDNEKTLLY